MSRTGGSDSGVPWAALALVAALLWAATQVVENEAWGAWIVQNCGWLCQ